MAHGKKYGSKSPNRGGRDTNNDLDFVVAEEIENEEKESLDILIMRGMANIMRIHRDEVRKLSLYVGSEYRDKDIRKELGRLVGRKKLKYDKGTYYLDV